LGKRKRNLSPFQEVKGRGVRGKKGGDKDTEEGRESKQGK